MSEAVHHMCSKKHLEIQKQPSRSVLRKMCSKNKEQIFRRTRMSMRDFNKAALQLYWNHTSAWVFSYKFAAYFQNTFYKNASGELLLEIWLGKKPWCSPFLVKFSYKKLQVYFKKNTKKPSTKILEKKISKECQKKTEIEKKGNVSGRKSWHNFCRKLKTQKSMHCLLENHELTSLGWNRKNTPEVKREDVSYLKRNKQEKKIQRKITLTTTGSTDKRNNFPCPQKIQ